MRAARRSPTSSSSIRSADTAGQAARAGLVGGQVAHGAQHVVQRVGVGGLGPLAQALQVGLHLVQRGGVDQLAQLLLAEQLAQQVAVQRQGGGAALRVGRVALVHVGGHVVEQQRGGERRRALGLDLHQRQLAGVQPAQQLLEARAGRTRRAGTRGRSRARSGTGRSAWPPPAATAPSAAAATAACACPAARGAAAARGRRSRGSGRRTARRRTARAPPGPRRRRARPSPGPSRAPRRRRAGGR